MGVDTLLSCMYISSRHDDSNGGGDSDNDRASSHIANVRRCTRIVKVWIPNPHGPWFPTIRLAVLHRDVINPPTLRRESA